MKLPLFDDYWIDFRPGTRRRWFTPEYWSAVPDGSYASLIYDPEAGRYRVYYETLPNLANDGPRLMRLAESTDMKTFTLPDTGRENIVFDGDTGLHGSSVMLDPMEKDPARRYKCCAMMDMGRDRKGGSSADPVRMVFSPDGVHWDRKGEIVVHPCTSDTLNKLYYDPVNEEYRLLFRAAFVDRRVSVKGSKDLVHWSEPRLLLHPGTHFNNDSDGVQHYGMTVRWFDGIFYGMVMRYNTFLYGTDFSRMFGYMEPELVYSYDGNDFMYTSGRALIERPYPPQPGCAGLSPMDICESRDGQWYYILCAGKNYVHGTAESNAKLAKILEERHLPVYSPVYRIRKDGFCGIESVTHGGLCVTKGLALIKDDLTMNIRADVGFVRFALMNRDGSFVDGFSFDDCVPFEYDSAVAVRPVWREHRLAEVLGRQIRIAVELNTAILHSIQGTAQPYIIQRQQSFGHPQGVEARND